MRRRVATFVLFLITVSVLSGGVWRYAYLQGLDQLRARGQADLSLVSDRLVGQLQRYRDLAVFLADHPQVAQVLDRRPAVEAQAFLQEVADKTTALDVQVLDRSGDVIVAALGAEAVRVPRADQRFVQRALRGALGWGHGPAAPLTDRAYFHAAPVFAPDGQVRGAVVVSTDLNGIDYDWRGSNPAAFFTDTDGVVQIANRSELLFWARPRAAQGLVPPDGAALDFAVSDVRGHEIWHMGWGPYLPDAALHLTRALPVVGMTGEVLLDIEGAQRLARAQAAAVAALCLAFGALLFLATERRRALSEANAALERQVAKRTAALNASNTELRREATEREEAQAALRRAQADLVQAGKIRHIGLSNESPWGLMKFLELAEKNGWPRVVSVQNPYSLLTRQYEVGLAECSIREDAGLLAYSPLGGGALSGKYLGGARPEGSRVAKWPQYFGRYQTENGIKSTEAYVKLAKDNGLDPCQMALAYVNSRPFLTSNIIGATSMEQLKSNIGSAKITLSDTVLEEIENIHKIYTYPCP